MTTRCVHIVKQKRRRGRGKGIAKIHDKKRENYFFRRVFPVELSVYEVFDEIVTLNDDYYHHW